MSRNLNSGKFFDRYGHRENEEVEQGGTEEVAVRSPHSSESVFGRPPRSHQDQARCEDGDAHESV